MKSQAYDEWIKMYDDNLVEIWHDERAELKNTSMLLFVLKKELTRIQNEVEEEVVKTRRSLERRDELNESYISRHSEAQEIKDKENKGPLWTAACSGIQPLLKTEDIESPEIFKVASPEFNEAKLEDSLNENETSPTISKRKLRPQKKFRQNLSPSLLLAAGQSYQSPATDKPKRDEFKTPDANHRKGSDQFGLDNTIIESTPHIPSVKKSKSMQLLKSHHKTSSLRLKVRSKKSKSDDTASILQQSSPCKRGKIIEPEKSKSSMAHLNEDDFPSSMEINDILKYVDEVTKESDVSSASKSSNSSIEGMKNCDNKDIIEPVRKQYLVSQNFLDNYDRLNSTTEDQKEPFKEVVRGKERKQLDGWACQECKDFYEGLGLPPEELKRKMNHCSKHRSNFKLQKTYSAFWEMDMPCTPASQATQEQSTVFHL